MPNSPHLNPTSDHDPITVRMPNGSGISSSHTCQLDFPTLPPEATQGHILPGLASHSLVSIAKVCDNGCEVHFSNQHCQVVRDKTVLLQGPRNPTTNLWLLPRATPAINMFAHQTMTKPELVQYLHAACYSSHTSTWIQAINNNQFTTWPGLTARQVTRHLPKSIATAQGHLDKARKNQQSTKTKTDNKPTDEDDAAALDATMNHAPPQQATKMHNVCVA
jgi:hypothetical protein